MTENLTSMSGQTVADFQTTEMWEWRKWKRSIEWLNGLVGSAMKMGKTNPIAHYTLSRWWYRNSFWHVWIRAVDEHFRIWWKWTNMRNNMCKLCTMNMNILSLFTSLAQFLPFLPFSVHPLSFRLQFFFSFLVAFVKRKQIYKRRKNIRVNNNLF